MKSPRPSASVGVSASAAHVSSSGESRPAVSSAIASCMAAAKVSPGVACTRAAWSALVSGPAVSSAFPRSRRLRRQRERRALASVVSSCRLAGGSVRPFWRWILMPANTEPDGRLFRPAAAALALNPVLLALTPAVIALALGKVPAA